MIVYSKNARIGDPTRLSILATELELVDWDFVLLSETHASTGTSIFAESHKLFCTLDTDRNAGVAILVAGCHISSVKRVLCVSDRVMAVDVMISRKLTRLIFIYFPYSGLSPQLLNDCYQQVFALIEDAVAKHLGIIVGGDLNSCLDSSPRGLLLHELVKARQGSDRIRRSTRARVRIYMYMAVIAAGETNKNE